MISPGPHVPVTLLASKSRTIGDLFRKRVELSGARPALYEKRDGSWQPMSWRELYDASRKVARGLGALGLERGDRVAILGPTRSPWASYDLGAQLLGLVALGIYPKQSPEQIRYILEHSEAKVVFVDDEAELRAVLRAAEGLSGLRAIVPWNESLYQAMRDEDERLASPKDFAGEPLGDAEVAAQLDAIDPEATALLVYTSGTTGPPKGAMISHRNVLSVLADSSLEFFEDDISLSFLPMAHVAERVLAFYGRISSGIATAYATSVGSVLQELGEVKPTVFGSVPRIYEKAFSKIGSEAEKKGPTVQKIFRFALATAREAAPHRLRGEPLPFLLGLKWALADKLVYGKVRGAFGGRVRISITGAAPIAREILEFFWGAGLPIYEVFGMTEATVMTHANRPGQVKLGTVGKVLEAMEHRIAEDGEVLLRGPFVFQGYYKNPEATAEAIKDGWLYTGDIGSIDAEGYLRITDRKKHLIITAGGKNLAPANIENAIKNQDPLISQVHAHGDRRPYVSAVIAPSPLETLEFGVARGLVTPQELAARTDELMKNPSGRSAALEEAMAQVTRDTEFRERIKAAVRAGNRELAQVEQVRRFTILDRDFSQEHGELTPTMKLKRKAVETSLASLFDRVYDEDGFALEP